MYFLKSRAILLNGSEVMRPLYRPNNTGEVCETILSGSRVSIEQAHLAQTQVDLEDVGRREGVLVESQNQS